MNPDRDAPRPDNSNPYARWSDERQPRPAKPRGRRDGDPDDQRVERPPPQNIGRSKLVQRGLGLDGAPLAKVYLQKPLHHPLVYRKRIGRIEASARPGDLVEVRVEPDDPWGYGLFNSHSEITVRLLNLGGDAPIESFWLSKLEAAVSLRRDLLKLDAVTDSYRVVHAEGDGLPGLVVDRYGDTLSAECFSLGMYQRCQAILDLLHPLCGTKHSRIVCGPMTLPQEGFTAEPFASPDARPAVTIQEFGTRFRVRFEESHKTGFFCDQRDNRRQLASFCEGKSVLDLCCYTGGFAVQAKTLGKAGEVTGVDLDEAPLAVAKENANLNQVNVRYVNSDIFPFMRDMLRAGKLYDVVVLDPPKLIRSRAEIDEGTRKHFDMNRLAMQLVKPGGMMLTCTCAGLLPASEFENLVVSAARQAGDPIEGALPTEGGFVRRGPRAMQILTKTGASADHPVASNCPESEYLNAIWMRLG